MRLFLDAHVSGRRVGRILREAGHDVRAADEEEELEGLEDASLLALAASEGRILVTFDVKDFPPILREWAEGGRRHAGCILAPSSIRHEHFGTITSGIGDALEEILGQEDWLDLTTGWGARVAVGSVRAPSNSRNKRSPTASRDL